MKLVLHRNTIMSTFMLGAIFCIGFQLRTPFGIRFAISDIFILLALLSGLFTIKINKKIFTYPHIGILLMFFIGVYICVLSTGELPRYVIYNKVIGLIILFLYYIITINVCMTNKSTIPVIRTFVNGVGILNIVALGLYFLSLLNDIPLPDIVNTNRFSGRLVGFMVDPNAYGGLLICSLAILVFNLPNRGLLPNKYLAYLFFLTQSISIILTYSRSAWLGLAIVLLCFLFLNIKNLILLIITFSGSIMLLVYIIGNEYINYLIIMATRQSQIDARMEFIWIGLREFAQSPFFGIGLGMNYEKYGWIIHNTPVWILVEFGLLGFLIFLIFVIWHIVRSWHSIKLSRDNKKREVIGITISFFAIWGLSLGIEALYQRHLWIIMALIISNYILLIDKRYVCTPKKDGIDGRLNL